jgi:hypothetical protein
MMVMAVAMMGFMTVVIMMIMTVALAAAAVPVLILRVHVVRSFQDPNLPGPHIPHWGMQRQAQASIAKRAEDPITCRN